MPPNAAGEAVKCHSIQFSLLSGHTQIVSGARVSQPQTGFRLECPVRSIIRYLDPWSSCKDPCTAAGRELLRAQPPSFGISPIMQEAVWPRWLVPVVSMLAANQSSWGGPATYCQQGNSGSDMPGAVFAHHPRVFVQGHLTSCALICFM